MNTEHTEQPTVTYEVDLLAHLNTTVTVDAATAEEARQKAEALIISRLAAVEGIAFDDITLVDIYDWRRA